MSLTEQVHKSNTSNAKEACRLRSESRAIRLPRKTHLCTSRDMRFCAPGARCSPHREGAVQRAGNAMFCVPEDAWPACRKTCPGDPCARPVFRACGRLFQPFYFCSGPLELQGQSFTDERQHARLCPHVRRASPSNIRALPRCEQKPRRKEVLPGFAVRLQRQKRAKRSIQERHEGSQVSCARACKSVPL